MQLRSNDAVPIIIDAFQSCDSRFASAFSFTANDKKHAEFHDWSSRHGRKY